MGKSQDWRFPKTEDREVEDKPGTLICPTCHAISVEKRWFLDEARYEELRNRPDVTVVMCPGCERVERGTFDGHVVLGGQWLAGHKDEILATARGEERRAREDNPFSRIGATKDHGDHIELFVTTQWLAERIGKALRRAFKGELEIDHLTGEHFSRVRWRRD